MNTNKFEKARIKFLESRRAYKAMFESDSLPSGWDTEWQPPFPVLTLREILANKAHNAIVFLKYGLRHKFCKR